MQKIAVIGASYLQKPLVEKAKELGLYTLCFAWPHGAVCKEIADEFHPISVVDKEEILSICRSKKIDGICTIASDVAAPTVAYVAEALGLIGNPYEVAVRTNDKFLMRETFSRGGIPCPNYQEIDSFEQLDKERITFPVIVKPVDRSGSLGVTKIEGEEGLETAINQALELSFKHEAIIEDYVEGRELSVECISYEGHHFPLQITDKITTGPPHFVELEHHQPSSLDDNWKSRIFKLTSRALTELGVVFGASHSEYRITADGQIFVMEIGARMGGDFIGSDLVYLSTGYDFLKGVIDVSLGNFKEPIICNRAHSGIYFLCKETSRLIPVFNQKPQAGIVRMEVTRKELAEVSCSADRSGYLIYSGDKRLIL